MSNDSASSSERYLGRVKWFNNKAGFGFVTCLDGDRKDEDVFVHHTGVNVASEQYKYLVQGEYVHFSVKKTENTDHPWQATDVRGVYGGWLMCETRHEIRKTTQAYNQNKKGQGTKTRRGGSGPREGSSNDEWVMEKQQRGSNKNSNYSQ
jgi:cold shock CspA family protein